MILLGISTSGKHPSAAVAKDGKIISFSEDKSGRSHSATLMSVIDSALNEAKVKLSDIGCIAADVGPGSFTGVRIGVSCANAMAYSLGIGVIPVASLAAMRHLIPPEGNVAAVIDCRNGNCYAALYRDGEEIVAPCAPVFEDFASKLPEGTRVVGDIDGSDGAPDAECVLREAMIKGQPVKEAVPMYLRPSQAERMKGRQST